MKHLLFPGLLFCLGWGYAQQKDAPVTPPAFYHQELENLMEYFRIPGLAALVEKDGQLIYEIYLGYADLETQTPVEAHTLFPIASVTKVFSAVLLEKLVEEGRLSLNDPVSKYLPSPGPPDSILVKHVLSHTSQGKVGEKFYYSSRFGYLTPVIEKASGQSFAACMESKIIKPLALKNTFLLKDSVQVNAWGDAFATPYVVSEEGLEEGPVEYGYSTSAGVVATARDLLTFSRALDENTLIKKQHKEEMFSPFREGLPYGYGIFSQRYEGQSLVWAYGQFDAYSSLFLKIPEKNLTLILLANSNLMSDPARLIYGDASSSLFVLSFLKNYVLEKPELPLMEKDIAADQVIESSFYRDKLRAQALAASFMARYDLAHMDQSVKLLEHLFKHYPDYDTYTDINLLHTLMFLKDVAFHRELGKFEKFDQKIESMATSLIKEDPQNPYLNLYLGSFYDRKGNLEKARRHYKKIAEAKNFSWNWYAAEAKDWLESHP